MVISYNAPLCFAAGTPIATPAGGRPIEMLRYGDAVVAVDALGRGRVEVVRLVGRRQLDLATHADPELEAPIHIRAGAIAPGVPARDLMLSPAHLWRREPGTNRNQENISPRLVWIALGVPVNGHNHSISVERVS